MLADLAIGGIIIGKVDGPDVRRGRPQAIQEIPGEIDMGDKGKKDKGKREQQKKALHTPKEKRQLKREKKQ